MRDLIWLSEAQMRRIERYFPLSHGVPRVDDRRIISGIVFVFRNGLRWRDAPAEYGPPKTLYNRFIRWSRLGSGEPARMARRRQSLSARPRSDDRRGRVPDTALRASHDLKTCRARWCRYPALTRRVVPRSPTWTQRRRAVSAADGSTRHEPSLYPDGLRADCLPTPSARPPPSHPKAHASRRAATAHPLPRPSARSGSPSA